MNSKGKDYPFTFRATGPSESRPPPPGCSPVDWIRSPLRTAGKAPQPSDRCRSAGNVIGQSLQKAGFDEGLDQNEHAANEDKGLPIDVGDDVLYRFDFGGVDQQQRQRAYDNRHRGGHDLDRQHFAEQKEQHHDRKQQQRKRRAAAFGALRRQLTHDGFSELRNVRSLCLQRFSEVSEDFTLPRACDLSVAIKCCEKRLRDSNFSSKLRAAPPNCRVRSRA